MDVVSTQDLGRGTARWVSGSGEWKRRWPGGVGVTPAFRGHRAGRVLSAGPCRGAWRGRERWGGAGAGARPDGGGPWVELVVGSPGAPCRCEQGCGGVEFANLERGPECHVGNVCLQGEAGGQSGGQGAVTASWAGEGGGWDTVRGGAVLALATLGPTDARRSSARASPPKCPQSSPDSTPQETCGCPGPSPPAERRRPGKTTSFCLQSCQVSVPAPRAQC